MFNLDLGLFNLREFPLVTEVYRSKRLFMCMPTCEPQWHVYARLDRLHDIVSDEGLHCLHNIVANLFVI